MTQPQNSSDDSQQIRELQATVVAQEGEIQILRNELKNKPRVVITQSISHSTYIKVTQQGMVLAEGYIDLLVNDAKVSPPNALEDPNTR